MNPGFSQRNFPALVGMALLLFNPAGMRAADAPANNDALAKIFQAAISNIKAAKVREDAAKKKAVALTGAAKAAADDQANQASLDAQDALTSDMIPYTQYLTSGAVYRSVLSDLEQQRLDKAVGTASGSSGGTSPVSKGSVPSLLGFAVEHGGLVESTNSTVMTFQSNLANLIKAMGQQDYLKSWIDPKSSWIMQGAQRLTASVSFDASQGGSSGVFMGSTRQISGVSAHFDIYSHRDPRHPAYYRFWNTLVAGSGGTLANSLNALIVAIRAYVDPATGTHPFDTWRAAARSAIASAAPDEVEVVVRNRAEAFRQAFGSVPALQPAFQTAANALSAYADQRRQQLTTIAKSPVVAVEYNFTRQFPEAQTLNNMSNRAAVTSAGGLTLPDLSNVTLIGVYSLGRSPKTPEVTANLGMTFFQSLPKGSATGSLRDWRFSTQLDVPLRDIQNIGTPSLSVSYLLLDLVEKPLGAAVTVNSKPVGTPGIVHLLQGKLTISVKNSGIKIPISFTYSNRTELNTNKEKRGTIGITYDLDSLFAKPK